MANPRVSFNVDTKQGRANIDQLRKELKGLATQAQTTASDLRKAFSEGGQGAPDLKNATKDANTEMRQLSSTNKDVLSSMSATNSEVSNASNSWSGFNNTISQANSNVGLTSASIAGLTDAQKATTSTANTATTSTDAFGSAAASAADATGQMAFRSQELTKSVQLALGPLSGVAARITAFTAIVNSSTVAVAGLVGAVVGIGAAISKTSTLIQQTERAMMVFDNRVKAMGVNAQFTADELENMSIKLAEDTLTSVTQAREAVGKLTSSTTLMRGEFERTLALSQDLAATGFGALETQVTRLLRAVEKPGEGLEGLRRAGVMFTGTQREMIENFLAMGDVAAARKLILDEVEDAVGGNADAADTYAGVLDTLTVKIGNFFREAADQADMAETLAEIYGDVSTAIQDLTENTDTAAAVGEVLTKSAAAMAHIFRFLAENIRGVMAALAVALSVRGFIGLVGILVNLRKQAGSLTNAFRVLRDSMRGTSVDAASVRANLGGVATAVSRLAPFIGLAVGVVYELWNSFREGPEEVQTAKDAISEFRGSISELRRDLEEGVIDEGVAAREAERAFEGVKEAADRELQDLEDTLSSRRARLETIQAQIGTVGERDDLTAERARVQSLIQDLEDEIAIRNGRVESIKDEKDAFVDKAKGEQDHLANIENLTERMRELIDSHADARKSYRDSQRGLATLTASMEEAREVAENLKGVDTAEGLERLAEDIRMSIALELDDRTNFQKTIDEMEDEVRGRELELGLVGLEGKELADARKEMDLLNKAVDMNVYTSLRAAQANEALTIEQEKWLMRARTQIALLDRMDQAENLSKRSAERRNAISLAEEEMDIIRRSRGESSQMLEDNIHLAQLDNELKREGIPLLERQKQILEEMTRLEFDQRSAAAKSHDEFMREQDSEIKANERTIGKMRSRYFMSQEAQQAEIDLARLRSDYVDKHGNLDQKAWNEARKQYVAAYERQREFDEQSARLNMTMQVTQQFAQGIGTALTDAMEAATDKNKTFMESMKDVMNQLGRMITQMLIAQGIQQSLGGGISLGGGGGNAGASVNASTNAAAGAMGNSKGGVFEYANGGIPDMGSRKEYFPMANGGTGSLRERGRPEAIMPLQRGPDGKLGVKSEGSGKGGGGNTYVQVVAEGVSEDQVEESREQIGEDELIKIVINTVAKDIRNRGPVGKAVHSATGTSAKGKRRG